MNKFEKSAWRESAILEKAATPDGFITTDLPEVIAPKTAQKACYRLMDKGALFAVSGHWVHTHYFSTQAAANAYRRRKGLAIAVRAEPAAVPTPKLTYAQVASLRSVASKPKPQTAPRADAVIIWPKVMPPCRMMPERYPASSMPIVRMGSAEWRAGVGA